ncbi:MAG: VCBS repeat-containing protein [Ignavibacteria bacterium]|nr:VCBS repeat-containing protein [Ignavibacteria bacterium]
MPTTIYKNTFSPSSNPNSLSYSLTNNNIFITDFSTIDTLMTFKVSIGNNLLQPLKGFPKFTGIDTTGNSQVIALDFNSSDGDEIFINSGNKTYGFRYDGSVITGNGIISEQYGKFIPSMITSGENKYLVCTKDFGIQFIDNNLNSSVINWSNSPVSTSPLINNNLKNVYIGKSNGTVTRYRIDLSGLRIDSASSSINQFAETPADTFTYIVNPDKYLVTGNITAANSFDKLTVNNNNEFFINGNKLNLNYTISALNSSPVLADVNNDGKQEIIFVGNNKLYAVNSGGVLLDNFPVDFNKQISSGISVADVNNDNIFDVLFATTNGDLYAYSVSGKVVDGFPVSIGPNTLSTPALADLNDTLGILVVSGDGYLYGFRTNSLYNESKILWKNYLKDEFLSNNNRVSGNNPVVYSEKLPSDRVYNWPNPVYDESTFLRYYLNGNASSVIVKVLDLSGELVATLPGTMISNSDNEVKWNVSEVQSGIYYGVIEAVIDGSKETKIIKIAVIK